MDKDYNTIILPKSLDKGTSYRTAVWVANSIFTRTGIPVVYGHTDEQKEFKEGDLVILGGVGGHDTGARLHQILNERKIDYFNVEKGYCNWWKPKFWRICFNENQWLGNRKLLPAGPLRENLSSIKRADCVFINGEKRRLKPTIRVL